MNRDEVIETLREHRETLAERFGVTSLALFGSYARTRYRRDRVGFVFPAATWRPS